MQKKCASVNFLANFMVNNSQSHRELPSPNFMQVTNFILTCSFRLQTPVPAIELTMTTREDNGTPDQGYSSTLSFRAITPGMDMWDTTS